MPSADYSFLDVAVLDAVRGRLAVGDAMVILSTDLTEIIWANGLGAALFGYADIEAVVGAQSGLSATAQRQIKSTRGYPLIGHDRSIVVRRAPGYDGTRFIASEIRMPDGEGALLLVVPAEDSDGSQVDAARAISGFSAPGLVAALLDRSGAVEAASQGFEALGIAPMVLSDLVNDVSSEATRIVKRIIDGCSSPLPAGIARLQDDPARHLLVVIDEHQDVRDEGISPADAVEFPSTEVPPEKLDNLPGETPRGDPTKERSGEHQWPFMDDLPAAPVVAAPVSYENADATSAEPADDLPVEADIVVNGDIPAGAAGDESEAGAHLDSNPPPEGDAPDDRQNALDINAVDAVYPKDDANAEATAAMSVEDSAAPEIAAIDRSAAPIRFVWKTDATGRFSEISHEFVQSVGLSVADVLGRPFAQVSELLVLDPSQEIAGLLERRDTWSGRSVFWPIAGTDHKVPVDLAALPIYSRDRSFEGFRGFGVARHADTVIDRAIAGLSLHETRVEELQADAGTKQMPATVDREHASADPFQGETPAIEVAAQPARRSSDKVIRLAEHRQSSGLSNIERNAFREIGERLKKDSDIGVAPRGTDDSSDALVKATPSQPEESSAEPGPIETGPQIGGASGASKREQLPAPTEPSISAAGTQDAPEPSGMTSVTPAAAARAAIAQLKTSGFLPSAFSPPAETEKALQDIPILARLPVPILIHSGDVLHYANEEFLKLTGYDTVGHLAKAGGLGALFADPYRDSNEDADRSLRLRTAYGDEFAIEALLRSVPWNSGHALMLVVRRAEEADAHPRDEQSDGVDVEALKAHVAEMRAIIDTATDGVVLIGPDHMIRSISRPAEALFGFESDDLNGKPFVSLFAMESQRAARDYLNGLTGHGVASVLNDGREVIGRDAQGRFIPLFMTIGKLPSDGGFCAVVRDITQWKRAEEELTQARSLAERASSQKSEFLARLSHEIRTPLNAMIGFSELMIGERFGAIANDRYRDYLQDINRSGNHVLELVNDLLDISKIEAGEQEMAYEAVSLNDALAQTVAMMQPQANRERVIIRSSFASRLPDVVADPRSVKQIALNLLSNAVRFTQAGGQVIVSTAYEPSGDVVMRVRDTGIGMTHAEIEQALKPFKQINALKRPRGDGTGLGLPLTKAMVEANRARFIINSTPGEGTLVEVSFPSTRVLAN